MSLKGHTVLPELFMIQSQKEMESMARGPMRRASPLCQACPTMPVPYRESKPQPKRMNAHVMAKMVMDAIQDDVHYVPSSAAFRDALMDSIPE
jgi:hypothetical protein